MKTTASMRTTAYGNTTNGTASDPTAELASDMLPALLNCFTTILLGYLAGRLKWLPPVASPVVSKCCGMILLPAVLFCGVSTIDFYSETFEQTKIFLIAICICKTALFIVTVLVSLVVSHKKGRCGLAALRGIFVTQSNDFSVGLPIFLSLYAASEPQMLSLLFLAAPINLLVLNPAAFVMMEYSVAQGRGEKLDCKSGLKILLKVVKNPITSSAFLGLVVNFCTTATLPEIIFTSYGGGVLGVLTSAFPFCSQFALGLVIVGKMSSMKPNNLPASIALIVAKVLILPLLGRAVVTWLGGQDIMASATFIYCAIPTSGGVFLYALQYKLSPHRIAISMLLCTIVSAPVLFFFAVMTTLQSFTLEEMQQKWPYYQSFMEIASVIGALWYIVSSCWASKYWPRGWTFTRHCLMCVMLCLAIGSGISTTCSIPAVMNSTAGWSEVLMYTRAGMLYSSFAWVTAIGVYNAFVFQRQKSFTRSCVVGGMVTTHILCWGVGAIAVAVIFNGVSANVFVCDHPVVETIDNLRFGLYGPMFGLSLISVVRAAAKLKGMSTPRNDGSHRISEIGSGEADQVDEVPALSKEDARIVNEYLCELVLVSIGMLSLLCLLVSSVYRFIDPDDLTTTFEFTVVGTLMEDLVSPVACVLFAFNKRSVLRPCIAYFQRCKCAVGTTCQGVQDDPTAVDPMWNGLSSRPHLFFGREPEHPLRPSRSGAPTSTLTFLDSKAQHHNNFVCEEL